MLKLIVIKTEIRTIIQWKIHLLADVLQLRVLFSKAELATYCKCSPKGIATCNAVTASSFASDTLTVSVSPG